MASQSSPEAPQSQQDELQHPHLQISGTLNEPPVVAEPTSGNVDTEADQAEKGADLESVSHHQGEKGQGEAGDRKDPVQALKARINAMEQRLLKAGLLKDSDEENQKSTSSPSSRQEAGSKPDVDQTKGPLKETKDSEKLVQMLMNKVDSFEKRLQGSGHLEEEPAADKPRLPAIPQLHYVEWSEFKNKYVGEEQDYAIEVLVGGAKYYHQRSEEERKDRQRLKNHSNDRDPLTTGHETPSRLPERIRINSEPILLMMNQVDPVDRRPKYPIVMLRPFKPLIYHEVRIREIFQRLLTKWGRADRGSEREQAVEPTVTSDAGKSTVPVVLKGDISTVHGESGTGNKLEAVPIHHIDSDDHTVSSPDEAATRSTRIYPSSAGKSLQSLPSISDNSIRRNAIMEAEGHPAKPGSGSEGICVEEAEDLADSLEALRDLRCLIEFIDVELKPVADSYRNMTRQKIPFCDLWHLFKPGDLVHSPVGNTTPEFMVHNGQNVQQGGSNDRYQEVWRVAYTTGGRPILEPAPAKHRSMEKYTPAGVKSTVNDFWITAISVDFNGSCYINQTYRFDISHFDGERDITSLELYPLKYAPQADELKSKCKSRGEAFREYTTFKYRYYAGKTLTCAPNGFHAPELDYSKHSENIDSQVVVDFEEAFVAHPGWRSSWQSLSQDANVQLEDFSEDYPTSYWKDRARKVLDERTEDYIYGDEHIDTRMMEDYVACDSLLRDYLQKRSAINDALDESHLMLLPNRVFAFVMKSRKWAMVTVDGLRPVKRYDGGLKDLQLPMGHKRTIGSLVGNHFINRNAYLEDLEASYDADLVRGKGKSLVILLHGAPGVGKTSTAETVADAFGKMLLPITCGDLGLTAAHVEQELSDKFHLAEIWDCVLLLDEADVFLARRTNTDIRRNSLVSVFLRILEHFTGVLFLTTNRVGAFDEAFKSRIHMSLYYPPLDAEKTWSIWKMNLQRLIQKKQRRNESIQIDEKEIFAYAQDHYAETFPRGANWNGRQIRNAFQTASALAEFEAYELNKKAKARSRETGVGFVAKSPQLEVRHFKEIAWASYEFDKYMFETKGVTEAEIASMEGQRRDAYQPTTRLFRARQQQPTEAREALGRNLVPNRGARSTVQGQAIPPGRPSESRDRQINFRPPGASTYDAMDVQGSQYDQLGAKSAMSYGSRTVAAIPRGERLRPNIVQQPRPRTFATWDDQRQQQVSSGLSEAQYVYENQEELEYGQTYEESLSQATNPQAYLDDTAQRGVSQRLYQADNLPVRSHNQAYVGDSGDEEEFLGV